MNNPYNLTNKNILITGASSGIGKACAVICAGLGANLFLTGRDSERLNQVVKDLSTGNEIKTFVADLSVQAEIEDLAGSCGKLDGFVNAAGILNYNLTRFITSETLSRTFSTNFFSLAILIKNLINKKKLNQNSSLVFIGSVSQKLGVPATAEYAGSKAALLAYSRVLATELGARKIRVNTVSPGLVETPMTLANNSALGENMLEEQSKSYPLGIGKPEDIGNLCAFLLSGASRWMTGTEIIIDGGHTLTR